MSWLKKELHVWLSIFTHRQFLDTMGIFMGGFLMGSGEFWLGFGVMMLFWLLQTILVFRVNSTQSETSGE